MSLLNKLQETTQHLKSCTSIKPQIGIILGSGLGSIAENLEESYSVSYSEIPYFHKPSIEGHAGKMIFGKINNIPAVILQGRFHYYEGHSMQDSTFPVRVLCKMGIQSLVITNAAGAVNKNFHPGDLMIIEDHLNLMNENPLIGFNFNELGSRFPDMSEAYSKKGISVLKNNANQLGIPFQTGVYAAVPGPSYETPAEIRMLRTLGADAVGMSTVPETIVARHMGVPVVGISCITNLGAGLSSHALHHHEVVENSKLCVNKIKNLIFNSVSELIEIK